jgi:acetyl esterase
LAAAGRRSRAAPPLARVTVASDIADGPDAKETFDIYQPPGKHDMPIVVFVHGGGYVAGDKNGHGNLIYANVAKFFARHGLLGVNANYRLAPQHPWPAGAGDVGKVVTWL